MRYLAPLAVIIIVQIGAAWALGDFNTARSGGSYATLEAETPAACERLCADDTLCMAWSFDAGACDLKAIVPAAIVHEGIISGVSPRAPASMRVALAPAATPAAIAEEHEAYEPPVAGARPEDDISLALLGGPETGEDLRERLEN